MYSARPGLLIGFHGCETELRNDVIAGNRALNASKNMHDWLGNGIYFWENNYERALDFAMNPPGKRKILSPGIPCKQTRRAFKRSSFAGIRLCGNRKSALKKAAKQSKTIRLCPRRLRR